MKKSEKIKAVRKALKLSQEDLADLMGRSTSSVVKAEGGTMSDEFEEEFVDCVNLNQNWFNNGSGDPVFEEDVNTIKVRATYAIEANRGPGRVIDPYKDALVAELKEQVEFYKELLRNITGGKKSFLRVIKPTGPTAKMGRLITSAA